MSCGVGRRHGLDLAWLWLWPAAVALIRPLAWEFPYATVQPLKKKEREKECVCVCIYIYVTGLLCCTTNNLHNIVNQLYFNSKNAKKKARKGFLWELGSQLHFYIERELLEGEEAGLCGGG